MLLICPVSVRFTLYVPSPQGYAVPKSSVSFHVNERVNRVSQNKSAYYAFFSSIVHVVCLTYSVPKFSNCERRTCTAVDFYQWLYRLRSQSNLCIFNKSRQISTKQVWGKVSRVLTLLVIQKSLWTRYVFAGSDVDKPKLPAHKGDRGKGW